MLTEQQMGEIKEELLSSERPMFFFHDDSDGLSSFLQFYKQVKKGKFIIVKSTPKLDNRFIKTVKDYSPDKIFALDLAVIEQDFADEVKKKIIWVDHHELSDTKGVKYYNPKQNIPKDNTCISKLSHDIFRENLWIAAVGTVGDWQLPEDLRQEVLKDYPELLAQDIKRPEQALFNSKLGTLSKIFNFIMKGSTKDANDAVKVLIKIDSYKELLEQASDRGKFLMKKFNKVNQEYEKLLKEACENYKHDEKLMVFTYKENKISLSGEISNELLFKYPDKIIIVARHHNGEMKVSFRSGKEIKVRELAQKALVGITGRVGGHENACGGIINDSQWDAFISNLKELA